MASRDDSAASLRAFRKAIRYTTKELAEAIGVPEGRYKNWEYAKASPPQSAVRELRKLGYGSKLAPKADTQLGNPVIPVGFSLASLPFAGEVPAGDWGDPLASEEFIEVEVKFEHPKRFAAKVIGDSCYPALQVEAYESPMLTQHVPVGLRAHSSTAKSNSSRAKYSVSVGSRPHASGVP